MTTKRTNKIGGIILAIPLCLMLLTACSTKQTNGEEKETLSREEPSSNLEKAPDSLPHCVYKSIKGIAEVIKIDPSNKQALMNFLPGEISFNVHLNELSNTDSNNIAVGQEFKVVFSLADETNDSACPKSGPKHLVPSLN